MHIPVLLNETLEHLNITDQPQTFIDATFGGGGHTAAILTKNPKAEVLTIDWDPASGAKVTGNYRDLDEFAKGCGFLQVDGILFDLGFSSLQLDEVRRGFAFQTDGPLDMRYSPSTRLNAADIVNGYSEADLKRIFREYGEERFVGRIARKICEQRKKKPIKTAQELKQIIGPPQSARRIFQALRIEVNDELNNLKTALPKSLEILKPGGRLVVISFHSLEDRIVKWFFKDHQDKLKILTKKVVLASETEINTNPRSKSAKLRAAEKI